MPIRKIYEYRQARPNLATSGQPSEAQLAEIAADGYAVVVNLALHNDPRYSLKDESSSVQNLGMSYVHIPVEFSSPTSEQLASFFAAMSEHTTKRVWVHCAANKRVTAFLGLYFVKCEGIPEAEAFALLRDVWEPDTIWSTFISKQLAEGAA